MLRRRRERREAAIAAERAREFEVLREQMRETSDMFRTDSGDVDLEALVVDMWEGAPTESMALLREHWQPDGEPPSGEALYEQELRRHWDGLDERGRASELEKLIRFDNMFREARGPGTEDAAFVVMHALVHQKALLLAWAHDQRYGGDYTERLYIDPLQFGVH